MLSWGNCAVAAWQPWRQLQGRQRQPRGAHPGRRSCPLSGSPRCLPAPAGPASGFIGRDHGEVEPAVPGRRSGGGSRGRRRARCCCRLRIAAPRSSANNHLSPHRLERSRSHTSLGALNCKFLGGQWRSRAFAVYDRSPTLQQGVKAASSLHRQPKCPSTPHTHVQPACQKLFR